MDNGSVQVGTSEPSPVPGAATAPVAEGSGDGENTLDNPEESAPEPSEEGGSAPSDGASGDANGGDMSGSSDSSDASAADSSDTAAASGGGSDHEVMARGVKFAPAILMIQPGDTVNWTNMASHNVETISDMMPEGAASIDSELGESVSQTFETEGIIVYKCAPHWGNRMGGIIVVGNPDNAMETIDAYMAAANENTENLPALGLLKDLRAEMGG